MSNNDNRRQWFRIDNPLAVDYRIVSEQEMNQGIETLRAGGLAPGGVSAMLFGMEQEIEERLVRIRRDAPQTADAIKIVNDKLNALINILPLLNGDDARLADQPLRDGNVSASGMAFVNHEDLPLQSCLHVRVALPPSYSYVETYARVVRCDPSDDKQYPFRVAIEFTYIPQNQQDLLVRFTMSRQSEELRKSRSA